MWKSPSLFRIYHLTIQVVFLQLLYHEKLRISDHSRLVSPHCLQLPKDYISTQPLPFALQLLSIIATALAAGTGSLGDTEHIACCRGLRTSVSNWKHIIMQNYRIIELGETWKDHMDDSRTGHIYVTPDRHLLHLLMNLNLLFCDWSLLLLTLHLQRRVLAFLFPAPIDTFAKCC